MRIITNRLNANIDYDGMLEQYKFFLITLQDERKNHESVYASLEELLTTQSGCTVVAFDGDHRQREGKSQYRRLYVVACSVHSKIDKCDIVRVLSDKCDIEEADGYTLKNKVPKNHILNVLLTLLPNRQQSVLYAHGKYLIGNCKDWNKNYNRRGELVFLHVFIDATMCLRSRVQTLTNETQFKSKKALKYATPYNLTFDDCGNVHLSTHSQIEGDEKFYDFKPKGREAKKNMLPFLCYKNLNDFRQCQAYVLNGIIHQMGEAYSFLTISSSCYMPSDVHMDKSAYNEVEEQYVTDFKHTHNIKAEVLDDDPATQKMCTAVNDILAKIGCETSGNANDAVIRVVPSLVYDDKLKKEERNKEKTRQSQSKLNYLKKGVPVQDVTVDHDDINEETVKNLIRQLAIKNYCLKHRFPQSVEGHFEGCTVVYGERPNGKFDIVTICLDQEDILTQFDTAADDGPTIFVSSLNQYVELQRVDNHGKKDEFFLIRKGDTTYQIVNTEQFVMPEVDNMVDVLTQREAITIPVSEYSAILSMLPNTTDAYLLCKQRINDGVPVQIDTFETDCSTFIKTNTDLRNVRKAIREKAGYTIVPNFKNKTNIEFSLSAYTNISYWEEPDSNGMHWCYTVGTKSQNFGTKTDFIHKTHIHHVFTDAPVTKDDIKSLIIDALHDGWLRINEFSVEPSIFKFAAEALEIHRTEMYANGYEFV